MIIVQIKVAESWVDSESRIWTYLDHLGDPSEIWMIWAIHGYPLFKKPPAMLRCLGWL